MKKFIWLVCVFMMLNSTAYGKTLKLGSRWRGLNTVLGSNGTTRKSRPMSAYEKKCLYLQEQQLRELKQQRWEMEQQRMMMERRNLNKKWNILNSKKNTD